MGMGGVKGGQEEGWEKNCGWNIKRNFKKINTNILGEFVKDKSLKICQNDKVWFFYKLSHV